MASRSLSSIVVIALLLALVGCGSSQPTEQPPTGGVTTPPPAEQPTSGGALDGEQLVSTKCKMCHTLDRVNAAEKDRDAWTTTVTRMQSNGLVVTEEEKAAIIEYLATR